MPKAHARGGEVLSITLASAAVLILSYVFLFGSSGDEEEFRFAILSAWLCARGSWSMDAAFWTPLLGLGVPQPFVPSFVLHPLAPLLAWMPPIPWVRLLLITHSVAGAIGMWLVGAVLGLPPIVRATGVVTFLLAAPVQNYVLSDFWPSHHVVWTLLPWVLLMAWRVLDPAISDSNARRWAGGLGLVSGILAANANPAYLIVFVPMAVAVLGVPWRTTMRRAGWIAAAALIAGAIAAPIIVHLVTEWPYFDPELERPNIQDPLPLGAMWTALAHPFVAERTARTLFFGAPFTVLALIGCAWFARRRLDLVVGFLVSLMLLFSSWVPMPLVSQRYQFRDPVTLCGILLAGLALGRIITAQRGQWIAAVAIGLQLPSIAAGSALVLASNFSREGIAAVGFHGAIGDTALVDTLIDHMPSHHRLLYSPRVSHAVAERGFLIDGLGVNALAYRGIPVVNGSFKGVSADAISPDYRLFYGLSDTPQVLLESDETLDVLAVRYALAYQDERVAGGLRALTRVTTARGAELVLYENPDAWPTAFLVHASFGDGGVPVIAGCGHDRVLCRNLGVLASYRDSTPLDVQRTEDRIQITLAPTSTPTVLVVSEMFRTGWTATLGERRLETRSMFGGLLGVPLPAGASEVTLHYRPRAQRMALIVCLAGILAGIGLIAARPRTHRNRSSRTDLPIS